MEEAKRWKLEPKPASLWWTSTYASEEKEDMVIKTEAGEHMLPFTSLEERMQSANKAWWLDVKICRSKDVPWRVKCRKMVDQTVQCLLFWRGKLVLESDCYGQDWRVGDESVEMDLQDEKMEDETVKVYCTRTARTVRSIWKKDEASPSEQNYC